MSRWVIWILVGAAVTGCSDEDDKPTNANNVGDVGSSIGPYGCCVDGATYLCSGVDGLVRCNGGTDLLVCLDDCGVDAACRDICRIESNGNRASGCQPGPDQTLCIVEFPDDCVGSPQGACIINADCASRICVEGNCYLGAPGDPCGADLDCVTGNCSNGCCRSTRLGEPCDSNLDCDSLNCTGGLCEGNATGDPCDRDIDCDSRLCRQGACL